MTGKISVVCFDVGETLVDERGLWTRWADWLGLPHEVFLRELRSVIARREHHTRVFEIIRPGFDLAAARAARIAAGDPPGFMPGDLLPDALPCLAALRRQSYRIGISGNTPASTEQYLRAMGFAADFVASSESWGIAKPSRAFFDRLAAEAGAETDAIAYVGDRIDNDVLPAVAAGMTGIWLRRGLWAQVQRSWPEARDVPTAIDDLASLPALLAALADGRTDP